MVRFAAWSMFYKHFLHLKILQIMRDNSFRHKFEMLFYVGKVPWLLNLFAQLKFSVRAPYF